MRAPRRPGGGDGGRGGRDRSPLPRPAGAKTRDHQRSEWRHDPVRARRSLSPRMRDRHHRRSPSGGRRSTSVERKRDHNAPSSSGRHDRDKQRPQFDPPVPSQSRGGHSTLAAFNDVDVGGGRSYDSFHREYLRADPSSNVHLDANSKASRAAQLRDFHHLQVASGGGTSSLGPGLDGQSMLVQKSMYLGDGSVQTFYSAPPGPGSYSSDATALNSNIIGGGGGTAVRIGVRHSEQLRYHERPREAYGEGEKEKLYPRDVPYPRMPPPQLGPYGSASSSGRAKDDFLSSFRDDLHLSSDGFGRINGIDKFRDDLLGHDGYNQMRLLGPVKRRTLSPPVRDDPRDYDYSGFGLRERGGRGFPLPDDMHKRMIWTSQGDYRDTLRPFYADTLSGRTEEIETSTKIVREARLWDHHHPLEGGAASDYRDMNRFHDNYLDDTGSGSLIFGPTPSHDSDFGHFGGSYGYGRDADVVDYRERSRSPPLSERHGDIFVRDFSPPQGRINTEDRDIYVPASGRLMKRKYVMDDQRNMLPNTRSAFKRIREPSDNDGPWTSEDRVGLLTSKRLVYGRPQHKMLSRRVSGSDSCLPPHDSFVHSEGGRDINLKRRLRPVPSDFHSPISFDRRQDFNRPYKFWKKGFEERHVINTRDGYLIEDDTPVVKSDPPVNSEEFKQQVHKAFLRFSKLLNENPHQQKRYREQGKTHSLLCCVCGSLSKEFVDTHSLITHAFHSLKVGLRTDHLGFHKALCVLMGWNWLVPPDNSRLYQSGSVAEAKALKEDLILWPPLLIVHNSSISNKNIAGGLKVVTNEGVEEIFRGMGYETAKMRVCQGKPADQSVLLVKFMPTFSGLQEAERLHKYYANNHRGREEFHEITASKESSGPGVEVAVEVEQLLYGYIGTAEDLDKLDSETKRRCLVKSKKEIEAIADAPLRVE